MTCYSLLWSSDNRKCAELKTSCIMLYWSWYTLRYLGLCSKCRFVATKSLKVLQFDMLIRIQGTPLFLENVSFNWNTIVGSEDLDYRLIWENVRVNELQHAICHTPSPTIFSFLSGPLLFLTRLKKRALRASRASALCALCADETQHTRGLVLTPWTSPTP